MGRVTIDEKRFINLLRKEEAYSELVHLINSSKEAAKAYSNHGTVVVTHTTYNIDDEELTECINKYMKIMGAY